MNLIFLGAPGSGKGTVAKKVTEKFSIPQISTGDLLREELKKDSRLSWELKSYMDSGKLVPDSIIVPMLKVRLSKKDCEKGFILDGFPRTIAQAELLGKEGVKIEKAVLFDVPMKEVYDRIVNRRTCKSCGAVYNILTIPPKKEGVCDKCGGELYSREDQRPEVITKRLEVYAKETEPLIEYYREKKKLIKVDANQIPEKVLQATIEKLRE
ncbi:adenylate kinase [Candidatus Woesearchaeota archaeon]|nr:adenylate kinase [Candidatus Woesearchaeota archaeon]